MVASEACCRNTVEPASLRTSIGMRDLWAAKMLFMRGMYWSAMSPDTLMIRIRDVNRKGWPELFEYETEPSTPIPVSMGTRPVDGSE